MMSVTPIDITPRPRIIFIDLIDQMGLHVRAEGVAIFDNWSFER